MLISTRDDSVILPMSANEKRPTCGGGRLCVSYILRRLAFLRFTLLSHACLPIPACPRSAGIFGAYSGEIISDVTILVNQNMRIFWGLLTVYSHICGYSAADSFWFLACARCWRAIVCHAERVTIL